MRLSLPISLSCSLLVSCSTATPPERASWPGTPPTPVVDSESFVLLVAEPSGFGACRESETPASPVGYRNIGFVFPGPPERRIGLSLDEHGEVATYADLRGAVEADTPGAVTNVAINLRSRRAYVLNRTADGQLTRGEVPLDEALESDNLGNPLAMMALVLDSCA